MFPHSARVWFATLAVLLFTGCANNPAPSAGENATLHLLPDRDVAEVLMAHCEGAIDLAKAVETSQASASLKALAGRIRVDEQRDHATLTAWAAAQSQPVLIAGETHAREIRISHKDSAVELSTNAQLAVDEFARRLLIGHYNEELAEIRRTPAKDKTLRRIVDQMKDEMTARLRELSGK